MMRFFGKAGLLRAQLAGAGGPAGPGPTACAPARQTPGLIAGMEKERQGGGVTSPFRARALPCPIFFRAPDFHLSTMREHGQGAVRVARARTSNTLRSKGGRQRLPLCVCACVRALPLAWSTREFGGRGKKESAGREKRRARAEAKTRPSPPDSSSSLSPHDLPPSPHHAARHGHPPVRRPLLHGCPAPRRGRRPAVVGRPAQTTVREREKRKRRGGWLPPTSLRTRPWTNKN